MAAEIIGGAFLSALFEKLFDKLGSSEYLNFFRESKIDERLLKKLQITLLSAEQLHSDAEEKQFGNPSARKWLFELKDAICAAEELLDEINYETLRYEHETKSGTGSSFGKRLKLSFSGSSRRFDEEIEEIRGSLEHIMKQKKFYGIKEGAKERTLLRLPAPLVEESCVYGRADVKEKIVNQLLWSDDSDGNKITVIPIVGMGGIGKTTLAQILYEDDRVRNHFDIRAWATVSDDFDIFKITKIILEDITSEKWEFESLDKLRRKLKAELTEKKFLIVLDDVWNDKDGPWDVLKSHFQSGACGSKIIVTTREENVVKAMGVVEAHNLEELSEDDCWSLFTEHVFGNANSDSCQDLHQIGREIVKKCTGLPLEVKALAGLLRSSLDLEEWKKMLTSDIWKLQLQENTTNNILPSLWLSYYYLPSHLKRCFTYCSIFPKNYEITKDIKESIIFLWMAEGLLPPSQKGRRAVDVGEECFQDLISRSLFQRSSKDKSIIVMHDRVHDLAMFLSGEFCLRLDDDDKTKFSSKTRHFSFSRTSYFENFESLFATNRLRTIVKLPLFYYPLAIQPPMPVGGCLRALCLPKSNFEVLPDSIGNLKLLRYLDLSFSKIQQIPIILCSLYYLQTLRLAYCEKLTELPTDMGHLVNLHHLDIRGVPLCQMPRQLCNLKNLETLNRFVLGKNDCSSIKELGGLHHLSGGIAISNLQNVDDVGDVREAKLKGKKYLEKIEYHWSSTDGASHDSQKQRNILDALQPHTNTKFLCIKGYGGEQLSHWMGHTSYANLATLEIIESNNRLMPPLGQLPSLQKLSISKCQKVKAICNEFYRETILEIRPFRSLKFLEFKDMSEWKEWLFLLGQEDGGCFPRLEELYIVNCPELYICFSDSFPSLKTLKIEGNKQNGGFLPETQQMDMAFPSLERLHIKNCPGLESFLLGNFSSNMVKLQLLGHKASSSYWHQSPLGLLSTGYEIDLLITGCEKVMTFPEAHLPTALTSILIANLPNLKVVNIKDFQRLTSLGKLKIDDCPKLRCFAGELLPTSLTSLHISNLPNLKELGKGFQHLICLKNLEIHECTKLQQLPEGMELPMSLTSLSIKFLPKWKYLCKSFQDLIHLEELEIFDCENLEQLAEEDGKEFQGLVSLRKLHIGFCEKLRQLPEWTVLPVSLTSLSIKFSPKWKYLCKSLEDLIHLEELKIYDCENLEQLAGEDGKGIRHLISLKKLRINNCEKLQWLLEEGLPTSLTSLTINGFPKLEDLSPMGIQHLVSLDSLHIWNCENLRSLPEEGLPPNLSFLWIYKCPLLEARYKRGTGPDWPKIAHIPFLTIGY